LIGDQRDAVPLSIDKEIDRMDESDESEMGELDERDLRILDALYHNAGIVASEDPSPPTSEELEEEAVLARFLERLIAGS
jgi:hypothetical protein